MKKIYLYLVPIYNSAEWESDGHGFKQLSDLISVLYFILQVGGVH